MNQHHQLLWHHSLKKDCAFQINIHGEGVVKVGKGVPLVISNEYIDGIIRIIKPIERSGVLIDGVIEAVIHEVK